MVMKIMQKKPASAQTVLLANFLLVSTELNNTPACA